jgi:catechol 2,3-dioxygenase-like lactoylglutathione lyase family enzyme
MLNPPLRPGRSHPLRKHDVFSHIFVGVTDFERALAFYKPLMSALGVALRFCEPAHPWAGWQSAPDPRPLFLIGKPYDGQPHARGNGQMVAFGAASRAVVDDAYAVALAHGGTSEGAPGPRPEYHANYYGAYFRDPDGNKLCVACHVAPELPPTSRPG